MRFGYNFVGWNTEPDGTGTDYAPGHETSLTGNLYLYAKWEAKEPVTLTYIYNDGEGQTAHRSFPERTLHSLTLPERATVLKAGMRMKD